VAAMQDFNGAVSRALTDFMSDHGVTQVQVATRLDRSQSYVSGRLNGKHDLSVDIIGAVAELARISPAALWIEVVTRTGQGSSDL
jgi:transcriptional regulator with XRE-family HTH domain